MLGQRGWQDNRWKLVEKGKKPTSLNGIRDFIRNRRAEMMKEIASRHAHLDSCARCPPNY